MDVSWWAMLVLVLVGWYWVICLSIGFWRLQKLLKEYERMRLWKEKAANSDK